MKARADIATALPKLQQVRCSYSLLIKQINIPSLNKKIRPALHPRQLQKELGMRRERRTDQPLSGIVQQQKREYFYSYKNRRQIQRGGKTRKIVTWKAILTHTLS